MTGTAKSSLQNAVVDKVGSSFGALPPALVQALRNVPAEVFARADALALEQDGQNVLRNILIREGRLPFPVDLLTRLILALKPTPACRALVYGAGTGYATALLAHLVREVHAIEGLPLLMSIAERTLGALGLTNVRLKAGDATACQEAGPFDVILITYGVTEVPAALKQQLAPGGRLVAPLGVRRKRQILFRITRDSRDHFVEERLGELRFSKRLGDLLVEAGAASRERVEQAARQAGPGGAFLGEILRTASEVSETDITQALATQRGMKFGTVDELTPLIELDVVRSVPRTFLEHHRVIPIRRSDSTLELATCDPEIVAAELLALFRTNKVVFWLITPTDYRRLWSTIDLMATGGPDVVVAAAPKAEAELGEHDEHKLEQRFIDLFESMLLTAITERASDIHLERYGDAVRVRIRVDGDLRDVPRYRLSPHDMTGIVNVIKIRSNLDIAEHRLPQGGRFRVTAKGDTYDLRVQTQPALHAEHVVIRLLPQKVKVLTIEDLGFEPAVAKEYRRMLDQPAGLILVVGPTGSGKTTTLYAGLQLLAQDPTRKVITVEDPIEYAIDKVQQSAVRSEIGFHFADAMRSFVRQDPDVILVGEIRDHETALEAVRASQTGHLVLSTLHCNDSTDAVQRLIDLQMHPNSIASELLAVISQRLARRICEGCRQETTPDPELLQRVFPDGAPRDFHCWKGVGCGHCSGHGSYGRVACVEFLKANAELRKAISLHPTVGELRRLALEADLVPMRDSALSLVRDGKIAFSDLPFLLSWERLAPERKEKPATT